MKFISRPSCTLLLQGLIMFGITSNCLGLSHLRERRKIVYGQVQVQEQVPLVERKLQRTYSYYEYENMGTGFCADQYNRYYDSAWRNGLPSPEACQSWCEEDANEYYRGMMFMPPYQYQANCECFFDDGKGPTSYPAGTTYHYGYGGVGPVKGTRSSISNRWYGTCYKATLIEQKLTFNWDIIPYLSETDVTFDDGSNNQEIIFKYNISNQLLSVKIFEANCQTLADDATAITIDEIDDTSEVNSIAHKNATIKLNVNQSSITSSNYWEFTSTNNSTGRMEFCIRLDLNLEDGTSISFHETVATVDVNLTKSFDIIGIDTDRDEAKVIESNTTLDYYTYAYQCNSAVGGDIKGQPEAVLRQGSFVGICVKTNGTGVRVSDIVDLVLDQTDIDGTTSVSAIKDGVRSDITLVDCATNPSSCFVMTQVVSKFFVRSSPGDILVRGTAVLAFQSSRRAVSNGIRSLQRETEDNFVNEAFGIKLLLQGDADDETGDQQHSSVFDDRIEPISGALCLSAYSPAVLSFVVMFVFGLLILL